MRPMRRTQSERTAETRQRLIDATIVLLLEEGMNGATVLKICQRAEVTTGALQHQFGSKSGLMAEVIRQLFKPFVVPFETSTTGREPLKGRIDGLVERYWRIYGADTYFAIAEILLATRHDDDLMQLVSSYRDDRLRQLATFLPVEFDDVDLTEAEMLASAHMMLDFLRGYAVHRIYEQGDRLDNEALAKARAMMLQDFAPHHKPKRD